MSFYPVMNNTKWNELRTAMLELDSPPQWRTKDIETGYISNWDGEWFYHFREGGYDTIEWVEVRADSDSHKNTIQEALQKIHVPGVEVDGIFRVFGHVDSNVSVAFI